MLKLAALVPGPPALPILGNALFFMAKSEGITTPNKYTNNFCIVCIAY